MLRRKMKHKIKESIVAMTFVIAVSQNVGSSDDLGYQGTNPDTFGHSNLDELVESFQNDPKAEITMQQGWTVIVVRDEKRMDLWSITPKDHFAYPSAVKRSIVERDGSVFIEMDVSCHAEIIQCDELVEQFVQLNNQMAESFK